MLPALISATVAVLLFALNEWVKGLRSRHDFLRDKLEQVCRLVVELRGEVIRAITLNTPEGFEKQRELISAITDAMLEKSSILQMLQILYFPALEPHLGRIADGTRSSFVVRIHTSAQGRDYLQHVLPTKGGLGQLWKDCEAFLSHVQTEYRTLTETPGGRFKAAWEQLKG